MAEIIDHLKQNGVVYLILSPFIGILGYFLVSSILKFLKGNIKIQLSQRTYNYGDLLTGSFFLKAKKMIRGEDLNVHVVVYETTTRTTNGKRQTSTQEITRFTHHIESGVTYEPGLQREYPINIKLPSHADIFGHDEIELPASLGDGLLGQVVKYGMQYAKSRSRYSFKIITTLEAEGVDLTASKKISIINDIGSRDET